MQPPSSAPVGNITNSPTEPNGPPASSSNTNTSSNSSGTASGNATSGCSLGLPVSNTDLIVALLARLPSILSQAVPDPAALYLQSIGYVPPPRPPAPAIYSNQTTPGAFGNDTALFPAAGSKTRHIGALSEPQFALAMSLPLVFLLALLMATIVYVRMRQLLAHRTLLNRVVPPGPGLMTTLVQTDLQSSTLLFEVLPAEVCH